MSVTAALVKELREKSGAGMMDCKKAHGETGGDMDAAIDWLRTKGLAAAAKKSGRVAAEGLVGISVAGTKGPALAKSKLHEGLATKQHWKKWTVGNLYTTDESS